MLSKFTNDFQNEQILHKLMVENWLYDILKNKWIQFIKESDSTQEQDSGIDFVGKYWTHTVYIDEKTRFTIPIYTKKINYTFALEISNSESRKLWWFLDNHKKTHYYLLLYPILDKNIWNDTRNYLIDEKWSIQWTEIQVMWVMGQLISVEKLRRYIGKFLDKHALCSFIKKHYIKNIHDTWTKYYDTWFNEIQKKERKNMYFTYTPCLKERPINLILQQSIYEQLREFEIYIDFKKDFP